MKKTKIKAVEMIRQIRHQQYEQLKEQSREEIMSFFRREAEKANAEAKKLLQQAHFTKFREISPSP